LWKAVTDAHEIDVVQEVQLLEACRAKDRLDKLDAVLRGDVPNWAVIAETREGELELRIDAALSQANATANQMKQLLAALRLPDEHGKKPQQRGGARGSYKPSGPAKVTAIDKFRAAAGS
jgi:hypothetical protein